MQGLAKAVQTRVEVGIRPQEFHDLLTMETVARDRREQLDQSLGGTAVPVREGDLLARAVDAETAEQSDLKEPYLR